MKRSPIANILLVAAIGAAGVSCGSEEGAQPSGTGQPSEDANAGAALSVRQTQNPFDIDPFDLEVFGRSETAILLVSEDGKTIYIVDASGDDLAVTDLSDAVLATGALPSIVSPITLCDEVIVASLETDDVAEIVGFEAATGDQLWRTTLEVDSRTPLACTAGIAIANDDATTVALNASDGTVAWTSPLEPDDPPLAAGNLAVIGSYDGVAGLAIADGEEIWREGGGSDNARAVAPVGALVELLDTYLIISPDGATLGELPDDLRDQIREENDVRSGIETLEIFGPASAPVIGAVGTNVLVDMDGSLHPVASRDSKPVELIGTSGAEMWGVPEAESSAREGQPVQLIDGDGEATAEVSVDAHSLVPFATTSGFVLFLGGDGLIAVVRN